MGFPSNDLHMAVQNSTISSKISMQSIPVCNLLSYQFEGESSRFCVKESQNVLDAIHHMAEVQIWGVSAVNGR